MDNQLELLANEIEHHIRINDSNDIEQNLKSLSTLIKECHQTHVNLNKDLYVQINVINQLFIERESLSVSLFTELMNVQRNLYATTKDLNENDLHVLKLNITSIMKLLFENTNINDDILKLSISFLQYLHNIARSLVRQQTTAIKIRHLASFCIMHQQQGIAYGVLNQMVSSRFVDKSGTSKNIHQRISKAGGAV
ncbi:unnamed protein product [Didymodactylos carnosus]|uniref:Uncharacterized protein n=1 Tax=Didymodactylos carnosus TaxID=1234261 RepID=A0A8S2QA53_9BILA|nr:unnamed protein product [Didymodactylos carnosus]CAF4089228.1 unnamed protein product [Didymodactylos carnosus]